MPPLREQDILFPTQASLSSTLHLLKRSNLSITNRLHSITADARFVATVADTLSLPLIANERCGSWYIPPVRKRGSAYFKSTDGHFGQWGFSLRRLNLGVLDAVGEAGGCIIIDSTRRGKTTPDALSKTVPIWLTVMNRLLFPSRPAYHALHTPADVVSASEHAQIAARLEAFVADVRSLGLDLEGLRARVKRPMRAVWVTPATDLAALSDLREGEGEGEGEGFAMVVCCTASGRGSGEGQEREYVQGAADDSEAWACGLDAVTFWQHSEQLLAANEDELPALIAQLVASKSSMGEGAQPVRISPPGNFWIGDNASLARLDSSFDAVLYCGSGLNDDMQRSIRKTGAKLIVLPCTSGKNGSRQLRACLPRLEALLELDRDDPKVMVTCHDGRDLSIGVALAFVCMFASAEGVLDLRSRQPAPNKTEIKKRLSWILVSKPEASPSRATLQSVNAFLMG